MNEKLKFNLNRLKKDFEDVIDELVEEIQTLNKNLSETISLGRYENLQDDFDDKETELEQANDKIEVLEEEIKQLKYNISSSENRIKELEQFLKSYKDV